MPTNKTADIKDMLGRLREWFGTAATGLGKNIGTGMAEGGASRIRGALEETVEPFVAKMRKEQINPVLDRLRDEAPGAVRSAVRAGAEEAKDIGQQTLRSLALPAGIGAASGAISSPEGESIPHGIVRGGIGGIVGGLTGSATGAGMPGLVTGSMLGGALGGGLGPSKAAQEIPMTNKYAGVTLDWYDDQGATLKTKFPTAQSLPDIIKEADIRPMEKLANEDFALVAIDEGNVLRKFACHDPGTTAMSVIYFMEHGDKLPEGAQKMAAANLVDACHQFGLKAPAIMEKMALNVAPVIRSMAPAAGVGAVTGGAVGAIQAKPGSRMKGALRGAALGAGAGAALHGAVGAGTHALHPGTTGALGGAAALTTGKEASVIDITGQRPTPKMKVASSNNPDNYAVVLPDGSRYYPIHTWDLVKQAEVYFQEEKGRMQPEVRRQYATKLAAKATAMGYPLDAEIFEAGAESWAPAGHLKAAVEMRKIACRPGEDREFLDELFEKRATVEPGVYAEVLRRFDVVHGFDKGWDHLILDPWASTFGMNKTADVVWEEGNDRVTNDQLVSLAQNHLKRLRQILTDCMCKEFLKDPVGIFESMPLPQKKIIARLAADHPDQSEVTQAAV